MVSRGTGARRCEKIGRRGLGGRARERGRIFFVRWAWTMGLKMMLLGIFGSASVSLVTGFEPMRLVLQTSAVVPSSATSLPEPAHQRQLERFRTDRTGNDAGSPVVQRAGLYLHCLLCNSRWSHQEQKQQQKQQHRYRHPPRGAVRNRNGGGQLFAFAEDAARIGGMWPIALVRVRVAFWMCPCVWSVVSLYF